jgi:hypothetical protein
MLTHGSFFYVWMGSPVAALVVVFSWMTGSLFADPLVAFSLLSPWLVPAAAGPHFQLWQARLLH